MSITILSLLWCNQNCCVQGKEEEASLISTVVDPYRELKGRTR